VDDYVADAGRSRAGLDFSFLHCVNIIIVVIIIARFWSLLAGIATAV
jgi:hypothetical protein